MCVLNNVICGKALERQTLIPFFLIWFFFPSAVVAETGREVPAEQARVDRLRVPGAGGLGVRSPPSRARGDATLQTPGAELLALAALRGRGCRLFPLGSPELQLLLEMQNQTANTSLSLSLSPPPPPKQFFWLQEIMHRLLALTNLCIVTFSKQVKTELLVNSSRAETGWQLTLPVGTTAIKVGKN